MSSGLEVSGLSVRYGKHQALDGVSLRVKPGEIVVILGANGAGKSTLLKAISGVCEGKVDGTVTMGGETVSGLAAHKVVERGIALVPEGRGIFGDLTVRENLTLGANPARARDEAQAGYDRLVRLFPKLADRAGQVARTMSGGEQQMVAIGRAMMSNPVILMLDEPSLGLSPLLSKELFQTLKAVRAAGLGILLVEQNAKLSLGIADRGYLLENGRILREDRADVLIRDPAVQAAYLGGASGHAAAPAAVVQAPIPADDLPSLTLTIRAKPPRSVSASDMVGFDIDALVAGAGAKARSAAPSRPATLSPAMAEAALATRSDQLTQALSEIEGAAARARERVRLPTTPLPPLRPMGARPLPAPTAPVTAPAPASQTPPAGRVEVYLRRPGSTQFDRTEV